MSVKGVLNLLSTQLKIANLFGIAPLKFVKVVEINKNSKRKVPVTRLVQCRSQSFGKYHPSLPVKLWHSAIFVSLCVSLIEIRFQLSHASINMVQRKLGLLASLAFHGFHLILTWCAFLTIIPYYMFPEMICQATNNMLSLGQIEKQKFSRFLLKQRRNSNPKHEKIVPLAVLIINVSVLVLPTLGIALASALFPKLYIFFRKSSVEGMEIGMWWRMVLFFLTGLRTLPICLALGPLLTLTVLTVYILVGNMRFLRKLQKFMEEFDFDLRQDTAAYYRKLQIFAILSNGYLQQYVWSSTQFNGSALIISLFYSVIVFGAKLDGRLLFVIVFILISLSLFLLSLIDVASLPLVISRKILNSCRAQWREHPWTRKFFESCQPIALRVGPFHKIDREMSLGMLRFCLLRTFFLVLKTHE